MDSKRIRTFKEFLQERHKKINEAVKLDVEWWNACIVEVLQILETQSNGVLSWDTLAKFCRQKWAILGRPSLQPDCDDIYIKEHIKDLVFQLHGDSLYVDWKCDMGWDNAQLHSKGLVIEEIASVILEKVREKTRPEGEPDTGETTATLSDREKTTLVPMTPVSSCDDCGDDEYYEDLPYESHKVKPVMGFNDYTKALNETVAMIDCENHEDCIQYVLGVVEKMVGSLDATDIAVKAYQISSTEVKTDLVVNMLKSIVYDYLTNQEGQVKIVGIRNPKGVKGDLPDDVFEQGLDVLCAELADEILGRIAKENGESNEE